MSLHQVLEISKEAYLKKVFGEILMESPDSKPLQGFEDSQK
jgi:hypothetical protein